MSGKKKVIIAVTNDLSTDQRIHKVATSLLKAGYKPILVGRKLSTSIKLNPRSYKVKRLKLFFQKGPFFYAFYNLRLFFYLIFRKFDIIVANDLDTLLASFLAFKVNKVLGNKKLKLVYDSHELFTEVPELQDRKFVKKIWCMIEKLLLPTLKNSYTVCDSIANYYSLKYKIQMHVFKNLPNCANPSTKTSNIERILPQNKKIILYQGAVNEGRGIERIIEIIDKIDNAIFVVVGKGDIDIKLKKLVRKLNISDKVIFTGVVPFENLEAITKKADIGLVLDENVCLNYHYSLPNRLFDLIKAKVPILASNFPEIKKIVEKEEIGIIAENHEPNNLIIKIKELLGNKELIGKIKKNFDKCYNNYCWETQEDLLIQFYQNLK